jgi:nitrile hydratase
VDGVHDLGGLDGFGQVLHEASEPMFHDAWERRTFRVVIGTLGFFSPNGGGKFRHSIERMEPAHYLSSSYFEHWLTAVSTLTVEAGLAKPDELERRAGGHFPLSQPDRGVLPRDLTPCTEPRYSVGDEVRVREWHPPGHTRAPRYVQGKCGTIARSTARTTSTTSPRTTADPSPTPSIRCVSPLRSCGERQAKMAMSSTSTYSSATYGTRDDR